MKRTFDKLGRCYVYLWVAILCNLGISIITGYKDRFDNIITVLSRSDIYSKLELFIKNNIVFEFISRYTGISLKSIIGFYIGILVIYVFITFMIPNIMYIINAAVVKHKTGGATNLVIWLLNLVSLIPGIHCTLELLNVIKKLNTVGIAMTHQIGFVVLEILLILVNVYFMIESFIYKENDDE